MEDLLAGFGPSEGKMRGHNKSLQVAVRHNYAKRHGQVRSGYYSRSKFKVKGHKSTLLQIFFVRFFCPHIFSIKARGEESMTKNVKEF